MLSFAALPLALATITSVAAFQNPSLHSHQIRAPAHAAAHHARRSFLPARALRNRRARRGLTSEPASLATGSLTAAEGCTEFYHVAAGEYCYKVVDAVPGLTLSEFYSLNEQIDNECQNLWAGYDYCVSRAAVASSTVASSSTKAASTSSTEAAPKSVLVKAAIAPSPTTEAPTQAPSATSSASDDEEDCDAETQTEEESSTAAPSTSAKPTTTAAPKVAAVAKVQTTTTFSSSAAAQTTKVADTSSSVSLLAKAGVNGFLGQNTNAIASWYHTNSATDSTNGHSWCYIPYDDSVPGFAPSFKTMVSNFGGDAIKAGEAYCGLEAEFTTPDGRTATLYLVDAFDDTWVRTPSSVDVIYDSFAGLFGSTTDNKNDVVQGVTWRFTGNRNSKYIFNNGNPV